MYLEALACNERRGVPAVGAAIDRRAFEATLDLYNDESIQSLICFVCVRICLRTNRARLDIEFKTGEWLRSPPAGALQELSLIHI